METFLIIAVIIALAVLANKSLMKKNEGLTKDIKNKDALIAELTEQSKKFEPIKETMAKAEKAYQESLNKKSESEALLARSHNEAKTIIREARERAQSLEHQKANIIQEANQQSARLIADARIRAEEIAGDAYKALENVDALEQRAVALHNIINGYGNQYLKPTYNILDDLAEKYGFHDAGRQLKQARERVTLLVTGERAAKCDYVEQRRKEQAIRFVLDAFNGKVDSILSRVRSDNIGTLERQIKDAYSIVNGHGEAFRNARITEEYLQARIDELTCAVAVVLVREQEKEEQREIRERMREEERARREIARALKEAAKEEAMLEKAMEKVREQVAKASDAQKAQFEVQLQALQIKLQEAEEKNQRALSMAQQTRAGHVYIISNIGSFGENVYKVGMTRRLEPMDRIRELGDASVPFSFDVHAMIWCEDAPALEHALHIEFMQAQINKINPKKEFFRIGIAELRNAVERRGIESSWTMAAAAAQYRESLAIEEQIRIDAKAKIEWEAKQAEAQHEMDDIETVAMLEEA